MEIAFLVCLFFNYFLTVKKKASTDCWIMKVRGATFNWQVIHLIQSPFKSLYTKNYKCVLIPKHLICKYFLFIVLYLNINCIYLDFELLVIIYTIHKNNPLNPQLIIVVIMSNVTFICIFPGGRFVRFILLLLYRASTLLRLWRHHRFKVF